MLFVNALVSSGLLTSVTPALMPASCLNDGSGNCVIPMAKMAATAGFTAVFLPALNFIVLVVLGRELAQVFGSELDLSRLSRLV